MEMRMVLNTAPPYYGTIIVITIDCYRGNPGAWAKTLIQKGAKGIYINYYFVPALVKPFLYLYLWT